MPQALREGGLGVFIVQSIDVLGLQVDDLLVSPRLDMVDRVGSRHGVRLLLLLILAQGVRPPMSRAIARR